MPLLKWDTMTRLSDFAGAIRLSPASRGRLGAAYLNAIPAASRDPSTFGDMGKWYGRSLYRFLDKEEFAVAFTRGSFRLSTLRRCRGYENAQQGDPSEGSETYFSGEASSGDPHFETVARRSGIPVTPGVHTTLRYNTTRRTLLDAFLLCLTSEFDPERFAKDFGSCCVEITDAGKFFDIVCDHLRVVRPDWLQAAMGSVIYAMPTYKGLEEPPGPLGLVKWTRFNWQKEARMVWSISPLLRPLNPLDICVPEVAPLIRRLR